jgi:hypothetical protein
MGIFWMHDPNSLCFSEKPVDAAISDVSFFPSNNLLKKVACGRTESARESEADEV